jgi:hypothetical protein
MLAMAQTPIATPPIVNKNVIIVDLQPITKTTGGFLAIMVAIFDGFKAGFSGIAAKNLPGCTRTGFPDPDHANGSCWITLR